MNNKYFLELALCLQKRGITTGPVENNCLPVLSSGQTVMWVDLEGYIMLTMAAAPVLEAKGLHGKYRLLSEYNGVVLAGRKLEGSWGYQFVTWRRNPDGASLDHGNYYGSDFEGAKLDFACRSGLVQECLQFTDEQLAEIYRCVHETLESGYLITAERAPAEGCLRSNTARSAGSGQKSHAIQRKGVGCCAVSAQKWC